MIWEVVLLFGVIFSAQGRPSGAISEQKVTIHHPIQDERKINTNIGNKKNEYREEYDGSYPSYEFSYKISDPDSKDIKGQHETGNKDNVNGLYWLIEPYGNKRTVKYKSEGDKGFKVHVSYSGEMNNQQEGKQGEKIEQVLEINEAPIKQNEQENNNNQENHREQNYDHGHKNQNGNSNKQIKNGGEKIKSKGKKPERPVTESSHNAEENINSRIEENENEENLNNAGNQNNHNSNNHNIINSGRGERINGNGKTSKENNNNNGRFKEGNNLSNARNEIRHYEVVENVEDDEEIEDEDKDGGNNNNGGNRNNGRTESGNEPNNNGRIKEDSSLSHTRKEIKQYGIIENNEENEKMENEERHRSNSNNGRGNGNNGRNQSGRKNNNNGRSKQGNNLSNKKNELRQYSEIENEEIKDKENNGENNQNEEIIENEESNGNENNNKNRGRVENTYSDDYNNKNVLSLNGNKNRSKHGALFVLNKINVESNNYDDKEEKYEHHIIVHHPSYKSHSSRE